MATTTNYGWGTPDDTDLVKDGALAIRDLGQDIDTTTKALNPETTTGDIAYRSATANTNTRLAIGTAGQVLQVNSGATAPEWATPAGGSIQTATFTDTKASATSGGTFTNGAYRTRDINTTQNNSITGCSLSSNQITLPAGTFHIEGFTGGYKIDRHQTRIYNITGSAVLFLGYSAFTDPNQDMTTIAPFSGTVTLAGSTVIELQHRSGFSRSTDGFGISCGFGNDNIYSSITITKVA
jgi:hypothetical protein